jgi:hypothetical protein
VTELVIAQPIRAFCTGILPWVDTVAEKISFFAELVEQLASHLFV